MFFSRKQSIMAMVVAIAAIIVPVMQIGASGSSQEAGFLNRLSIRFCQ